MCGLRVCCVPDGCSGWRVQSDIECIEIGCSICVVVWVQAIAYICFEYVLHLYIPSEFCTISSDIIASPSVVQSLYVFLPQDHWLGMGSRRVCLPGCPSPLH